MEVMYLDEQIRIVQNSDGGYTIAGSSSPSGNLLQPWIFRTDLNGNILWSKTYGEVRITSSIDLSRPVMADTL